MERLSLFDVADRHAIDVYVAFTNRPNCNDGWWRLLKEGFRHVEVWRPVGAGFWLRCEPNLEFAEMELHSEPPWVVLAQLNPTVMRVQRTVPYGRVRDWFMVGPVTCVEITKAFIGVRNAFIRTPYQLYRYLRRCR